MIAIADLGLGNLNSVRWALERLGAEVTVTRDADVILAADGLVLPGVGNFEAGANRLAQNGLGEAIRVRAQSVPLMGICLGLQLLFEGSEEGGNGLGLLPGTVTLMAIQDRPLPHMGWNTVEMAEAIETTMKSGEAYFCHSYAVRPTDTRMVLAWTTYGERFASAIKSGTLTGVQFHPEKSGSYGRRWLEAFIKEVNQCLTSSRRWTSRPDASYA